MMRAAASRLTGLLKGFVNTSNSYLDCWMCTRNITVVDKTLFDRTYQNENVREKHLIGELQLSRTKSMANVFNLSQLIPFAGTPEIRRITPCGLWVQSQITITRGFHTSSPSAINFFRPRDDTTWWGRTLKKLGITEIPKSVLKKTATLMYMKVVDELDYKLFFKNCNLPDTFTSWFITVELHICLLSARLMQDGAEGRVARNALIKAWYEDNDLKSKQLEGALSSARRRDLKTLSEQFNASMIAFDEGLLGDDYVLAGTLWRRFLQDQSESATLLPEHFNSPEKHKQIADKVKALELLVIYVRSQFIMLNSLSREQLLRKRAFKFMPFDNSLYELVSKMEETQITGASRTIARKAEAIKVI